MDNNIRGYNHYTTYVRRTTDHLYDHVVNRLYALITIYDLTMVLSHITIEGTMIILNGRVGGTVTLIRGNGLRTNDQ